MTSCPCCGSEVSRPVLVSLDTNTVSTAKGSMRVEPQCAEFVAALLRKYPNAIRIEALGLAVWGESFFDLKENTLRVGLHKARKAIAPLGIAIETISGVGYRLSTSKTEGA